MRWSEADLNRQAAKLTRNGVSLEPEALTRPYTRRRPRPTIHIIQPEKAIQAAILGYLRAKGVVCWKNRAVGIMKPSGAYIPIPEAERGVADIIGILKGGRTLAIEVKRHGKEPTLNQQVFLERVNQQGGLGFVARSIDDCQKHGI